MVKQEPPLAEQHVSEGEWEDLNPATPPGSPSSSTRGALRRRRSARAVYIATPPRKQFAMGVPRSRGGSTTPSEQQKIVSVEVEESQVKPPLSPTPVSEDVSAAQSKWMKVTPILQDAATEGAIATLKYVFEILSVVIHLLRKPLAVLLFFWVLSLIVSQLSYQIRSAFAPLCIIPGVSYLPICAPAYNAIPTRTEDGLPPPKWADYPKLVDLQTTTLEQLLDESIGGSGLALEVKKAEMATNDLITLVRVSDLTSRDLLAQSLVDFVENARNTGKGLQKLSSKVGGAVDSIYAVNDHALRTIESATKNSKFSLTRYLPFGLSSSSSSTVVRQTFVEAMSSLSANMHRLILEAEVSLQRLDKLEQQLNVIHELAAREDVSLSSAKNDLLAELWTMLGGNKRALRGVDNNLLLLKGVGSYRQRALAHVVAALQTLEAMSQDMEDLRERVAAPELVGEKIPVEVHMKSIKSGLQRINDGRLRAKEREDEAYRRILGVGAREDH